MIGTLKFIRDFREALLELTNDRIENFNYESLNMFHLYFLGCNALYSTYSKEQMFRDLSIFLKDLKIDCTVGDLLEKQIIQIVKGDE